MLNFDNKKNLVTAAIVCCIAVPLILLIVYITPITLFLSSLLSVFSPIIIGIAIAYILNPMLEFFEFRIFKKLKNKHLRRGLSIFLTYIIAIALIVAFLFLLIPQLVASITDLSNKFGSYIAAATEFLNNMFGKLFSDGEHNEYINAESLKNAITKIFSASNNIFDTITEYVKKYGLAFVNVIKNSLLAFFISIYILLSKERLLAGSKKIARALFKEKNYKNIAKYLKSTNKTFGGFFVGKLIDSAIIGVLTLILLLIFRMPYSLLVSVIVGITNIIPVFGPFIGAIPSAFIIFIAQPKKALIFIILIILIQQLDGNVIGPKILGNSTGLSSLGVIVAIIIMGSYFGVIGMIIGVPIFAVLLEIIREIIDGKLKAKKQPTDIAEYFPAKSLVDPHEHHETLSSKLFAKIGMCLKKLKDRALGNKTKDSPIVSVDNKEKNEKEVDNDDKREQ